MPTVLGSGLSISLKRTNPGIVGVKPAELIFDIVNTDVDHRLTGFILCRSPDDVQISSTLGLSSGSGSQYVSPVFELDVAPSQKAVYFTVDSNYPGDYSANCIFKHIPYREVNGNKVYLKMNLEETETIKESDYREIRLDKNVPFVQVDQYANAYCPKPDCKSSEVITVIDKTSNLFFYLSVVLIIGIIVLLALILRNKI
jgi:hypothetical protein